MCHYTGCDEKQAENSNNGRVHKDNFRNWNARNEREIIQYSSFREAWLLASVLTGMNGNLIASFAQELFTRTNVLDSGSVPRDGQGMFLFLHNSPSAKKF